MSSPAFSAKPLLYTSLSFLAAFLAIFEKQLDQLVPQEPWPFHCGRIRDRQQKLEESEHFYHVVEKLFWRWPYTHFVIVRHTLARYPGRSVIWSRRYWGYSPL